MKRRHTLAAGAICLLAAGGCIPRRVFWSPDGQRAALIAEDGLRLCDASGKLSDVVAQDVQLVAWMPDSSRFIGEGKITAASWQEAQAALSPERREALIRLAGRLHDEILAYSGEWDKFRPKLRAEVTDGELSALFLYVRDHRKDGLPEKLGDKWKDMEKMTADVHLLQVYEVSDLSATPGPILTRTLDDIWNLQIAPDGGAVACAQAVSGGKDAIFRLSVMPAGGGALQTVAEPAAIYPDWTPDGRSLVYTTTRSKPADGGDAVQLGTLSRRRVRAESGRPLKEFEAPDDRVGGLFWPQSKVRCLRDGRVLFSAMEVMLPATAKDMPQRATLFCIDPARQPTATRVIPREAEAALPDGLQAGYFELSPDEKRVAVCGADHGNVSVLTLATGEVQRVVSQTDIELRGLPAWRSAEELSVFVPPKSSWGSADRYELVLWSGPEKARCLSCGWPPIFEKKAAPAMSSPATRPAASGTAPLRKTG